MKKLVVATVAVSLLLFGHNANPQEHRSRKANAAFFARQLWEDGHCWGREDSKADIRFIGYDHNTRSKKKRRTTETTMPALDEGERILGKECSKSVTLVFTNNRLLVYPGGDALLNESIESRVFWVYTFDNEALSYARIGKLKFAVLFANRELYTGEVDPVGEEINWELLGVIKKPEAVEKIGAERGLLVVNYKDGEKEKFRY